MRKQWNSVQRFSLRKYSTGLASVLLATMFMSQGVMAQSQSEAEENVVTEIIKPKVEKGIPSSEKRNENLKEKSTEDNVTPVLNAKNRNDQTVLYTINDENGTVKKTSEKIIENSKKLFNTEKLEELLKEINSLKLEKYTVESVNGLKEKVAKAKEVLTTAKNQEEVNTVYKELVNYKNSSLRRVKTNHKPLEEKTPKLDTTNGKETAGKKAENNEPNDRNIAGHNHILNGTTLPEGSGLRAAPNNTNFTYETVGADLSSLVAGEELGYGKKVIIKVKYDTKVISTKDVYITTTPNTGPRTEYTRRQQDGIGPYDGGTNIKLVGQIPNDMIGTYDLHIHVLNNKRNNAQMATLNVPITVKPKKPTVSVADLVNAEGKRPVVTATVANTSISKVEFYLNGQKQTVVNATNGQATWTPTNALRENDRITVKNIAQGGIPPRDAYGNTFTTREATSDMSDAVVIPKAPKTATPNAPTVVSDTANARVTVTPSTGADRVEVTVGNSTVVATKNGSTWTLSPTTTGVSIDSRTGVVTVAHNAASAGTQVRATAKHGNSDASTASTANLPAKETTPNAPTVVSDTANARVTVTPSTGADRVEVTVGNSTVVATKNGSTWTLSPTTTGVSIDSRTGVVTVAHNAASAGTQVSATAKHGNSDASTAASVTLPGKAATPAAPTVVSDEANAQVTVTPSADADRVEVTVGNSTVVATKTGSTWSLTPTKDGVSVDPTSGVITVAHNAASAGTQVSATAKHGNSDASTAASVTLPGKATTPAAPSVVSDEANARVTVTPSTDTSQSDNGVNKALLAKKSEVKMLIEKEVMKKKAEISQAELSESEKELLDTRVEQEKAKAFQMIDQATTIEEVDYALMAGIKAIRSIPVASASGGTTNVTTEASEKVMAQANRQMLPQTGTGNEVAIFGAAASAILAGLGLIVPSQKKED